MNQKYHYSLYKGETFTKFYFIKKLKYFLQPRHFFASWVQISKLVAHAKTSPLKNGFEVGRYTLWYSFEIQLWPLTEHYNAFSLSCLPNAQEQLDDKDDEKKKLATQLSRGGWTIKGVTTKWTDSMTDCKRCFRYYKHKDKMLWHFAFQDLKSIKLMYNNLLKQKTQN